MLTELSFGQIAKNRRRELGLTQDELARRVGCAPITLRKIEADDLRPSVQIAERMAMALNIALEERAAFVKLARAERAPFEERSVTPMPAPEEIGSEDLSGRAIRGYALGERLGSGGMGAVYRAVQPLVEREVAIKIILPQFANHPDFIRRFEAEAQLVARLEHPHIVPLYDYWREPRVAYLVMRLLRGGSVQSLLRNESRLVPDIVLRMMEQVGSALSAAHRAGVVHRDLKPANVLLDEDNNAYLADFGIAKNLSSSSSETQADVVIGSPDYISPEQIRSELVRPQTDIYALGVMLYELLTGALPFRGPTPFEVMHQHLSAPLPPLAANHAGLPKAIDDVIAHATVKDPFQRYETVDAMLVDFRRALGVDLHEMKGVTTPLQNAVAPLIAIDNPYKGLRAFGEGDAQDFFGREALTQQLLVRLGESGELARFLAIVGPSGSGKSSVVKAGLIPALRRGALPGSENWFILEMTPGSHPLEELEAALLRVAVNPPASLIEQFHRDSRGLIRAARRSLPDDPNIDLVLVIDQFEEVFTLLQDEKERLRFLGLLVAAALDEHSRIRIVITLRADFIDRPLGYMDFGELLRQRMEIVLPLTPDEMERAIVSPADRVGLILEPGLLTTILHDLGDQPGTLPLLQYALTELFEKREDSTLTKSAYQNIGGVLGALGRRAEEIFTSLDQSGQAIAKQLFLRLVTLGEGAEDTRRRALIFELESLQLTGPIDARNFSQLFNATLNAFGRARLLSFDRDPGTRGPTVEVAHEAILREWTRLRDWLSESRAAVRLQRQLTTAVSEWEDAHRDESFLLTGAKLAQYEGWMVNSPVALTQRETDYLKASIASREKHVAEEAARHKLELETAQKLAETEKARAEEQIHSVKGLRQRAVLLAGALALALIAAIFAGVFANRNGTLAIQNASIASTAQAEAQNRATAEANALQQQKVAQQQAVIARARELSAASLTNLSVDPERSILLALQAVNETYAVAHTVLPEAEDALHRAVLASRARLTLSGHTAQVVAVAYSPDGTRLATASQDGTAKVWDAVTGKLLLTLREGHTNAVNGLAYSPDGRRIATANGDNTAQVFDAETGRVLLTLVGHAAVGSVAYSPDGKRIVTSSRDNAVKMWDAATGKELFTLPQDSQKDYVEDVAFSPDGKKFATASDDHTAKVWDAVTGKELLKLAGHTDAVVGVAFSPNGAQLATVSYDNNAKVWDAATGVQQLSLNLSGQGLGIAFSADGSRLATTGLDGKAILWDVTTGRQLLALNGHTSQVQGVAFSPDGTRLATASWDNTAKVWDISPSRELLTFIAIDPAAPGFLVSSVAYSPDGTRLATANNDEARIWDAATGRLLFTLHQTSYVDRVIFSPDGTRLVSTSNDATAKVWDVFTGKELLTLTGHTRRVGSAAYSPDGTLIATASDDGTVKVWDALTGKELLTLTEFQVPTHRSGINTIAFSPSGKYIATAGVPDRIIIWDAASGRELFRWTSTDKTPLAVAFSPDGKRMLTTFENGTIREFDLGSDLLQPKELFSISGHSGAILGLQFSPDGKRFATASIDNTVKVWDSATGQNLLTLLGHERGVFGVAFSPDGTRLATGGVDGTVRVYLLRIEDLVALAQSRLTRTWTTDECQKYLHVEQCP